jgi:DNA invertase Pin-like site-specific DNA recombinase
MRPAIAYARVSTKNQGKSGLGLNGQMAQIQQFADDSGFQVVRTVREVASATGPHNTTNRPELVAAIALSRENSWPIIVASLDRLTRNVNALERLVRQGLLDVHVADLGGRVGALTMRCGAARAQFEAQEIGRRTRQGVVEARKRGVLFGNPRLSEVRAKGSATNATNAKRRREEFDAAILAIEADGSPAHTAKQIAGAFNERGFKTARGRNWTAGNVASARRKKKEHGLKQKAQDQATAERIFLVVGAGGRPAPADIEWLGKEMLGRGAKQTLIEKMTAHLETGALTEKDFQHLQRFIAKSVAQRK